MNDGEVEGSRLGGNAQAQGEHVLEHERPRDPVPGILLPSDRAKPVIRRALLQEIDEVRAPGLLVSVKMAVNLRRAPRGAARHLLLEAEREGIDRTGLNTERDLFFPEPVAAHRTLGGFLRDVVFGDDAPGACVDAVFAPDAELRVDDDRPLLVFGDRLDRTNRRTHRKFAMHAAVASPKTRHALEHRRLDGQPIRAGKLVDGGARMIVPVLARLNALAATDAFGRIEKNCSRSAVEQPACRKRAALDLPHRIFSIRSWSPYCDREQFGGHVSHRHPDRLIILLLSIPILTETRKKQVLKWGHGNLPNGAAFAMTGYERCLQFSIARFNRATTSGDVSSVASIIFCTSSPSRG